MLGRFIIKIVFLILLLKVEVGLVAIAKDSAKLPFDRLFTDYQERVNLNRANSEDSEIVGNVAFDGEAQGEHKEMTLKFNGYIKSENGKSQFWVTKVGTKDHKVLMQPQLERVRKLPIYSARKTRQMKPGQTWLINDNKVLESYEVPPVRKPESDSNDNTESNDPNQNASENSKPNKTDEEKQVRDASSTNIDDSGAKTENSNAYPAKSNSVISATQNVIKPEALANPEGNPGHHANKGIRPEKRKSSFNSKK